MRIYIADHDNRVGLAEQLADDRTSFSFDANEGIFIINRDELKPKTKRWIDEVVDTQEVQMLESMQDT